VFKKDGTPLTKEDINAIQEKFSLEKIYGEYEEEIFPFNLDGTLGDIIHSPLGTIVEFDLDTDGERIKKLFENKYGLGLRR